MARYDNTRDIDWLTVCIYLGLVLTGWLMIYAVSYSPETANVFNMEARHGVQVVWIGVSLSIGFFIMLIDGKVFQTFAYPIYIIAVLLLFYVLVAGRVISGSKSWFDLGFFRFQPSEVAKFATCLALASFLGSYNMSLKNLKVRLTAVAFIVVPMTFVLLQGDAGSALVFSSLFIVLYREGMPVNIYIIGITVALLSIVALMFDDALPIILGLILIAIGVLVNTYKTNRSRSIFLAFSIASILLYRYSPITRIPIIITAVSVFIGLVAMKLLEKRRQIATVMLTALVIAITYTWSVNTIFYDVLKPHQQDRILVWLRPEKVDPLGALYNVTWSKRAIGSGGFTGKGFLQGNITKLSYVPEQATDFIFCTVGEEQGFIGAFAVIMLFLLLLMRILFIAERQRSKFTRIYAYGVASILFFHLLVNIGMTMGLVPVIGIPLPFISYGGSSLIAFTILVAILLRLDSNRLLVFR
jgi:rod shape determining protein RodA